MKKRGSGGTILKRKKTTVSGIWWQMKKGRNRTQVDQSEVIQQLGTGEGEGEHLGGMQQYEGEEGGSHGGPGLSELRKDPMQ